MVGGQAEAAGEPAQRGGGVHTLGGEERVEFGDHGRAGVGEEPFAKLQLPGGQGGPGRGGQRRRLTEGRSGPAHLPPFGARAGLPPPLRVARVGARRQEPVPVSIMFPANMAVSCARTFIT
jgi:hypothetical protein